MLKRFIFRYQCLGHLIIEYGNSHFTHILIYNNRWDSFIKPAYLFSNYLSAIPGFLCTYVIDFRSEFPGRNLTFQNDIMVKAAWLYQVLSEYPDLIFF